MTTMRWAIYDHELRLVSEGEGVVEEDAVVFEPAILDAPDDGHLMFLWRDRLVRWPGQLKTTPAVRHQVTSVRIPLTWRS